MLEPAETAIIIENRIKIIFCTAFFTPSIGYQIVKYYLIKSETFSGFMFLLDLLKTKKYRKQ